MPKSEKWTVLAIFGFGIFARVGLLQQTPANKQVLGAHNLTPLHRMERGAG